MIEVVLVRAEGVARDTRTLWFRPERPVRFIAGQFTELYLPHEDADERGTRRWFTISSSPTEKLIGINTKFAANDSSSYKRHLQALQPGAVLKMADPMGDFVLPKNPSTPILFVAGGMGITPVRSMVKWLIDTGEQRNIRLLYIVNEPEDLAFQDIFRQYSMEFMPYFSSQDGRITAEQIAKMATDDETVVYLSGPEQMVETFYKQLQQYGISSDRLAGDYYPGYPQA
jgi:ferredoxin-NADP reductase